MNEDKATRYNRLKRRAGLLSLLWGTSLLALLLVTPASIALREAATRLVAAARVPAPAASSAVVVVYVTLLGLLSEAGSVPIGFYRGFVLEHRYGLSTETVRHWAWDHLKASALGYVFGVTGAVLVYLAIRWSPAWWWLAVGIGFSLVTIVLTRLAPVLLLPLFFRVRPLEREELRRRLVALAAHAGTTVLGVYEWGLGQKTRKANAALTGLGATRRILVSDTLLADYSEEEIEVILAHELGHHVHHDIWKGIAYETVLSLAGCYLAYRLLVAFSPVLGLFGPSDPAGLPLLSLAAGAVSLIVLPAVNAISRAHERGADRFALELTRNPGAFISAMRRLGAPNLAEDRPSAAVKVLFYSHPPIRERIEAAEKWAA